MKFEKLALPIAIKKMRLKNRIVMPAISTNFADSNGYSTDRQIEYYKARARGGTGLIVVEFTSILYPEGRINVNQLGAYSDEMIPSLKRLCDEIHGEESNIAFQIGHGGKRATRDITGVVPKSAWNIPIRGAKPDFTDGEEPKVLSRQEIADIVVAFGEAASRVKNAGADAIEIHGAHGFLLLEFLSPYSNKREDEYGGDAKRRSRLPCEVVEEVRRKVGEDFPIIYRISADEGIAGGLTADDLEIAVRLLKAAGVDIFSVTSGNNETPQEVVPPASYLPGFRVHLAERVRKLSNVPVIASGRINSPELAEAILQDGSADLIAVGRGLLSDPEFAKKCTEDRDEPIRKCIGCNQGCIDRYRRFDSEGNSLTTCILNPAAGREATSDVKRAIDEKRIFVVGGGAAGMQAAYTASLRGHRVVLFEKEASLGGQLKIAAKVPGKAEMMFPVEFLERSLLQQGVEIRLGKHVTIADIKEDIPDAVIIATGASAIVPTSYANSGMRSMSAYEALIKNDCGQSCVIVGGGMIGCDTAEYLAAQKKKVSIVEKADDIARGLGLIRKSLLRQRLLEYNVDIYLNSIVEKVESGKVLITGNKQIATESIIFAVGKLSNSGMARAKNDIGCDVYYVGDCVREDDLLAAIHGAFNVARRI